MNKDKINDKTDETKKQIREDKKLQQNPTEKKRN
jgi:hypothetical protein